MHLLEDGLIVEGPEPRDHLTSDEAEIIRNLANWSSAPQPLPAGRPYSDRTVSAVFPVPIARWAAFFAAGEVPIGTVGAVRGTCSLLVRHSVIVGWRYALADQHGDCLTLYGVAVLVLRPRALARSHARRCKPQYLPCALRQWNFLAYHRRHARGRHCPYVTVGAFIRECAGHAVLTVSARTHRRVAASLVATVLLALVIDAR